MTNLEDLHYELGEMWQSIVDILAQKVREAGRATYDDLGKISTFNFSNALALEAGHPLRDVQPPGPRRRGRPGDPTTGKCSSWTTRSPTAAA